MSDEVFDAEQFLDFFRQKIEQETAGWPLTLSRAEAVDFALLMAFSVVFEVLRSDVVANTPGARDQLAAAAGTSSNDWKQSRHSAPSCSESTPCTVAAGIGGAAS